VESYILIILCHLFQRYVVDKVEKEVVFNPRAAYHKDSPKGRSDTRCLKMETASHAASSLLRVNGGTTTLITHPMVVSKSTKH
jgi:hypothetical protein